MKATQLKELIIKPALNKIDLYSKEALELVFGTACVESCAGEYIRQFPAGPALGIFQMELATYNDLFKNYLNNRPGLKAKVMTLYCPGMTVEENLTTNLIFAAAMCRIHYLRASAPIPGDLSGWAAYWKKYYNTKYGKGTPEKFIKAYERYNI